MSARNIFALAIRLLGLVFLYLGLKTACGIWGLHGDQVLAALLSIICFLAVAWWLISGAPLLMARAYPSGDPAP